MPLFSEEVSDFVDELDEAINAHLDWSRRVLRCAVLHETPAEDILAEDAHRRCRFGQWFNKELDRLQQFDARIADRVCDVHKRMHAAVRSLCRRLVAGGPGSPADLEEFERTQSVLITELAHLKTEILARSARHDALTGLPLRYGLEDEFARHLARAQRLHVQLHLFMLDVDHFKHVNDAHGHSAGDLALQHVAAILRGQARIGEPVFRFGGEEFLLLMLNETRDAAAQAADRLLAAMRATPLRLGTQSAVALTASGGLVQVRPGETMAEIIERADQALYAAKAAGRDRWLWAANPDP